MCIKYERLNLPFNVTDQNNEIPFTLVQNPAPSNGYCGLKNVTIKYKVCNRNRLPIKINDQTWVKYNGITRSWEDSKLWIDGEQCKTYTTQDQWDPCVMARDGKKASKYMEAQISARIVGDPDNWKNNGENAYCYCHLFKAARTEYDNPPAPTEKCTDAQNFRITEIVHKKYVEVLNKECANKEIVDELYLVRIPFGSNEIELNQKGTFFKNAYSLQAATGGTNSLLPSDGFLLACHSKNIRFRSNDINCDSGSDDKEYFPLTDGRDTYAIVKIENGNINNYKIIDIYGSTLSYSSRVSQDLSLYGRAQRHTDISTGFSQFWQPNEWYIRKSNAVSAMDPRQWQNAPDDPIPFIITEITNPNTGKGSMPPKYIEIYSNSGEGERVNQPIQLVIFHDSGYVDDLVPSNVIDLQGLLIPSDGYMLFCNQAAAGQYGERACDYEFKNYGSPVTTNGDDNIALIRGDLSGGKYEVLDIFGRIGVDGTGTEHNFVNSRVVRDVGSIFQNSGIWNAEEWCILEYDSEQSLNQFDPADPRKWTTRCNTPEPTPSPSFIPSHVPSIGPSLTQRPSVSPTSSPTTFPTDFPSFLPSSTPTGHPTFTQAPSPKPSSGPTVTSRPTNVPSSSPTSMPSNKPSDRPSSSQTPSIRPSSGPTKTFRPSSHPTQSPTASRYPTYPPVVPKPLARDTPAPGGKSKGKGKAKSSKTKGKGKGYGKGKGKGYGKGKYAKYSGYRRRRSV